MQEITEKIYAKINNLTDKVPVSESLIQEFNSLDETEQEALFCAVISARSRKLFHHRMNFFLHPEVNYNIKKSDILRKRVLDAFTFSEYHASYIATNLLEKLDIELSMGQSMNILNLSLQHSDKVVASIYDIIRRNHTLDSCFELLPKVAKRGLIPFYKEVNNLPFSERHEYIHKIKKTNAKPTTIIDCVLLTHPTKEVLEEYLQVFHLQRSHLVHILCTALKDCPMQTVHLLDEMFNYQDFFNRELNLTERMSKSSSMGSQLRGVSAALSREKFEFLIKMDLSERVKNQFTIDAMYTTSAPVLDLILEHSPSPEMLAYLMIGKMRPTREDEREMLLNYLITQPKALTEKFLEILKLVPEKSAKLLLIRESRKLQMQDPEQLIDVCEKTIFYHQLKTDLPQSTTRLKRKI